MLWCWSLAPLSAGLQNSGKHQINPTLRHPFPEPYTSVTTALGPFHHQHPPLPYHHQFIIIFIIIVIIISDTQAEDGTMEFSISVPNLQETSLHRTPVFNRWSNVPAIVNTDGEAGIKWQPQYFSWWQLLWCTLGKTCRHVRAILFKPSQSRPRVVPNRPQVFPI